MRSEGKMEMTDGAKKEQTVAVMYIIPIARAPRESVRSTCKTNTLTIDWNGKILSSIRSYI